MRGWIFQQLFAAIIFQLVYVTVSAQGLCLLVTDSVFTANKTHVACAEWKDYISVDPDLIPLKRIRVSVHILCKEDTLGNGSELDIYGNFAPTQANRDLIRNVFEHASGPQTPLSQIQGCGDVYANLSPFQLPNSSEYIRDSRIRFVVDSIYFWFRDSLYEGMRNPQDVWQFRLSCWKHCVLDNPGNNPDAMQVYLGAFPSAPNYAFPAQIDLVVSSGFYNDVYNPGNLRHEIAHALGLIHTIHDLSGNCKPNQDDGCDDTPMPQDLNQNPCCWNGITCSNNLVDNNVHCHALTACQIGMIHAGLMQERVGTSYKALIPDHCKYDKDKSTIIKTGKHEVWMGSRWLQGDLIIQSGASLVVRCTVSLPEKGSVKIEPGGQLIIDGGLMTNVCGNMWRGIEVQGLSALPAGIAQQGRLVLKNGAGIEFAETAVALYKTQALSHLPDFMSTGGSLLAHDAIFRDNLRAIAILPHTSAAYPCRVERCSFLITGPLWDQNKIPEIMVSLWGVKQVIFKDNIFENQYPPFRLNITAVRTSEASCILDRNKFHFLSAGVFSDQFTRIHSLRLKYNEFYDCLIGVFLQNCELGVIENNYFAIPLQSKSLCDEAPALEGTCGLYLKNCSGYSVQKNSFISLHSLPIYAPTVLPVIGCIIEDSGIEANQIRNNEFSSLHKGLLIRGLNRDIKGAAGEEKGLQVLCNSFHRHIENTAVSIEEGSIAHWQGDWDALNKVWIPAGNTFYHYTFNGNNPSLHYWNDRSQVLYPVNYLEANSSECQMLPGTYDPSHLNVISLSQALSESDCAFIIPVQTPHGNKEISSLDRISEINNILKYEADIFKDAPQYKSTLLSERDRLKFQVLGSASPDELNILSELIPDALCLLQCYTRSLFYFPDSETGKLLEKKINTLYPEYSEYFNILQKAYKRIYPANETDIMESDTYFQLRGKEPENYGSLHFFPGHQTLCGLAEQALRGAEVPETENKLNSNSIPFLYPNPCKQNIKISFSPSEFGNDYAVLMDFMGNVIAHYTHINSNYSLDVSDLSSGLYILHFIQADGKKYNLKFVHE